MTPDPERLRTLLALVAIGLRHEIANHLAAHPRAASYDSDRTTGGAGSDPTPTAALGPDPARRDLERHDHAVDQAYAALLTLVDLTNTYAPLRQPRRGTMDADRRPCQLHDRAGVDQHHQAAHRSDLGSFLAQPLKDPVDVCEACYQQIRRTAKLPTADELIRHDRTGKWAVRTSGKRATVFSAQDVIDEWTQRGDAA